MIYNDYMNMNTSDKELFLRDSMSRYRTKSLFYEYKHPEYDSIFTLKPYDYNEHRSLKQIYMDLEDPTEGLIGTDVFTSYEHWKQMTTLVWFRDILAEWREELQVKLRAKALAELIRQSPRSTAAAQFLAKGQWEQKRGRPSKVEKEGYLKEDSRNTDKITELFRRATTSGDEDG